MWVSLRFYYMSSCVIAAIICCLSTELSAKLQSVSILVRTPKFGPFFKVDEEEEWTEPLMKLSEEETNRAVKMGRRIRELYIRAIRLIPSAYTQDHLELVSADSIRAIQTAQAIGVGLFEGSNDKIIDIIPVRHREHGSDDLLTPCNQERKMVEDESTSLDNNDAIFNKPSTEAIRALWSDFKRFFRVRSPSTDEPEPWVFESALETLLGSSAASRDEMLLTRVLSVGKALGSIRFRDSPMQSRLAHEIFKSNFASSTKKNKQQQQRDGAPLRVFVTDNEEIMLDLLRASTFSPQENMLSFPSPHILMIEYHDDSEIDARSNVRLVRVLQDFAPVTCSDQGDFYCEYNSFLRSAERWLMSPLEWEQQCSKGDLGSEAVANSSLSTASEVSRRLGDRSNDGGNTKTITIEETIPKNGIPPDAKSSTAAPARKCGNDDQDSDEDFIHGFLVGCIFIGLLVACRCRSKPPPANEQWTSGMNSPELDDQHAMKYYGEHPRPNETTYEGAEVDIEEVLDTNEPSTLHKKLINSSSGAGQSPIVSSTTTGQSKSTIAHIPRPKASMPSPLLS